MKGFRYFRMEGLLLKRKRGGTMKFVLIILLFSGKVFAQVISIMQLQTTPSLHKESLR